MLRMSTRENVYFPFLFCTKLLIYNDNTNIELRGTYDPFRYNVEGTETSIETLIELWHGHGPKVTLLWRRKCPNIMQ